MGQTGKTVEVLFEKTKETYEHQMSLLDLAMFEQPDGARMQNSNNVIWRPVQQHAALIDGFDVTGQASDIIEETYPAVLGTPKSDFIKQRADEMRDIRFWERRGVQSGKQQATELNRAIANAIAVQGSLFYRSNAASGYEFIAEAQAVMNERQVANDGRCFVINDRDNLKFGADLAARQTLQGRPDETWKTGQIGANIAEFDIYTGSFLPNLLGGVDPATTTTALVSEKPEGGSVDPVTGIVTNVDYRVGNIPVLASAGYNVGDKVIFVNGATPVQSVGLADKNATGQPMTFTIVGVPDANTVQVYPKPIANDDVALSVIERAYSNIDTQIANGAIMSRQNIDPSTKTNLFWDKSAVEVLGGTIPAELLAQFGGKKVVHDTMENGQELYLMYDGDIESLDFTYRIFTWYGITVCNPSAAGVALSF